MKIEIQRLNDAFQMEAKNSLGNTVIMDSSQSAGGHDLGLRPMEMILSGMGGCSTIDILHILKKQRLQVDDIQITVEGQRADQIPAVFTDVHLHYKVIGNLPEEKIARAIQLSLEKYCSVSKMLENTVKITSSFEVIQNQ